MQELKKHKTYSEQHAKFYSDDKENFLINKYEREQEEKKSNKRYLREAEKLIMKERLKDIVADNVQYFRNIRKFHLIDSLNK